MRKFNYDPFYYDKLAAAQAAEEEAMAEEAAMAEQGMGMDEEVIAAKIEEDYAIAEEISMSDMGIEGKVEALAAEEVEPEIIAEVVELELEKSLGILEEISGGAPEEGPTEEELAAVDTEADALASYYGINPYIMRAALRDKVAGPSAAMETAGWKETNPTAVNKMNEVVKQHGGKKSGTLTRGARALKQHKGKAGIGAAALVGAGYLAHRAYKGRRGQQAPEQEAPQGSPSLRERAQGYAQRAQPYAPAVAGAGIGAGLGAGIGYGLGGRTGALIGAGLGVLGGGAAGHAKDHLSRLRGGPDAVKRTTVASYQGMYPYFDKLALYSPQGMLSDAVPTGVGAPPVASAAPGFISEEALPQAGRFKRFISRINPAKLGRGGKIALGAAGVGALGTAAYGTHRFIANRRAAEAAAAEAAAAEAAETGFMGRVNPYLDMARPYAPAAAGAGIGAGLGAGIGYGLGGGYGALAGAGIGALGGGAAGHYGYPAATNYWANRG